MLIEAADLAVLAAISPAAPLVAVVYLGSARPRVTFLLYPAGAVVIIAPEPTTPRLPAFDGWLCRNGRMILACTLVAAGLIVATDGLAGLIEKG